MPAAKKTAAKTAKPSTAVATRASGAIVDVKAAMAAQLAKLAGKTAPATGNKIRITQSKEMVLPDGTKTRDPIELVVVDFLSVNNFYEGTFDKDNIVPPTCFAIGDIPLKLVPSKNSPVVQADDCASCPNNAWESGPKGKGKACKNTRLLAVLPPDADADTPMWLLQVSPTGLKSFDNFVGRVSTTFQTPPVGAVVTVSLDENSDWPTLVFRDETPNENAGEHLARLDEARKLLETEPDVSGYGQAPAKKAPARPAAKKVAARAR
jgi:hypothetical protein